MTRIHTRLFMPTPPKQPSAVNRQRLFIVSLPRSGSTVLTTMLDQYEDFLCLPESYFPALLETLTVEDFARPDSIAALFLASCLDGSPITLEEAQQCIGKNRSETLAAVENKVAEKFGRTPDSFRVVVWKYTRFVGMLPNYQRGSSHFVVLKRNPLNVFESQFRVHFGEKNRSSARFALFEASYIAAFSKYPRDLTLRINYPDLPEAVRRIVELSSASDIKRLNQSGGLGEHSGRNPWHSEITKPFKNTDPDKLLNLTSLQKTTYFIASILFRILPFIGSIARIVADRRELKAAGHRADTVMQTM